MDNDRLKEELESNERVKGHQDMYGMLRSKLRCLGCVYGVHAQDFGFSSMQLWLSRVLCQSRSKYAVRRLVTTLERTKFCSYCVGLFAVPTRRRG